MSIELKIKAKHLALEPMVIKHEEAKLKTRIKHADDKESLIRQLNSLTTHRKWNVRNESRATGLARAFLRGKPYAAAERKRHDNGLFNQYIVPRIVDMANKYGSSRITRETITEWATIK